MSVTSKVRLKDVYYNVSKLRSAAWDAPLSTSRAVISDFETLIALIPDELSLVEVHKLLLLIYSGVGDLLGSVQWGYQGYMHAYWTLSHQLVCLFRDLEVRVFDTKGHLECTYSLGKDAADGPLMAACSVSHKGFFAAVKTTEGSKILHLASPTEATSESVAVFPQEITCMAAVFAPPSPMEVVSLMTDRAGIRPPTFDSPCLVVGLADGSVRIVPTTPDVGTFAFPGVLPVTRIVTSASQKFVALVSPSSKQIEILQTTSIFACAQTRDPTVLHIAASAPCPPHTSFDIVWVADDCLLSLCSEASPLLLGGPGGEWIPLGLKGLPATKTSEDGVLMLFDDGVYNLQKVHPSISSLIELGRVGPSSIVYYTYERTRNGTLGADDEESLRCLERQLPKVIRVCCTAAEKSLFTEDGKKCLGAAMLALDFGDRTSEPDDSDFIDVLKQNRKRCVALIRDLRIQKGLSESLKAWWSVSRLRSTGLPVVVVELCWLQHFELAFRMGGWAGVFEGQFGQFALTFLLRRWSQSVILKSVGVSNKDLFTNLMARWREHPAAISSVLADTISFAAAHGREDLAAVLLDLDPDTGNRVSTLLRLNNYKEALAVGQVDSAITQEVLYRMRPAMKQTLPELGEVSRRFVVSQLLACGLEPDEVQELCQSAGEPCLAGLEALKRGLTGHGLFLDPTDRAGILGAERTRQATVKLMQSAALLNSSEVSLPGSGPFIVQTVQFLEKQKELENQSIKETWAGYPVRFQGLPTAATVYELARCGKTQEAQCVLSNLPRALQPLVSLVGVACGCQEPKEAWQAEYAAAARMHRAERMEMLRMLAFASSDVKSIWAHSLDFDVSEVPVRSIPFSRSLLSTIGL